MFAYKKVVPSFHTTKYLNSVHYLESLNGWRLFSHDVFTIYLDYVGSSVAHRLYLIVCFPSFTATQFTLPLAHIRCCSSVPLATLFRLAIYRSSGDYRINTCIASLKNRISHIFYLTVEVCVMMEVLFHCFSMNAEQCTFGYFTCVYQNAWIQKWWCMQWWHSLLCAFNPIVAWIRMWEYIKIDRFFWQWFVLFSAYEWETERKPQRKRPD